MEDSTTSGWDSAMDTTLANGFPRHTGVGIDILQRERETHTNKNGLINVLFFQPRQHTKTKMLKIIYKANCFKTKT